MQSEEHTPELSIIIPVYNAENTLRRLVESIRRSVLSDFEVLLVDDGSPDGSGPICDALALADPRIHAAHTPNRGPSAARNRGMALARGEFITFADSDDTVEPEIYSRLVAAARESDADVAVCRVNFRDGTGRSESRENTLLPPMPEKKAFDWRDCGSLFRVLMDAGPWNKVFRKSFLEKNRLSFPENLRFCEDAQFWIETVFRHPRLAFTPYRGYNYFVSTGNSLCKIARRSYSTFPGTLRFVRETMTAAGVYEEFRGEYCFYLSAQTIAAWTLVAPDKRRDFIRGCIPVFREAGRFGLSRQQRRPAALAAAGVFFAFRSLPEPLLRLVLTPLLLFDSPAMRRLLRGSA